MSHLSLRARARATTAALEAAQQLADVAGALVAQQRRAYELQLAIVDVALGERALSPEDRDGLMTLRTAAPAAREVLHQFEAQVTALRARLQEMRA